MTSNWDTGVRDWVLQPARVITTISKNDILMFMPFIRAAPYKDWVDLELDFRVWRP